MQMVPAARSRPNVCLAETRLAPACATRLHGVGCFAGPKHTAIRLPPTFRPGGVRPLAALPRLDPPPNNTTISQRSRRGHHSNRERISFAERRLVPVGIGGGFGAGGIERGDLLGCEIPADGA